MVRELRALAAIGLFAAVAGSPLFAQSEVGQIVGTVTDVPSDRPLSIVQVYIPDTGFGGLTDGSGRFVIARVPVGEHSVRARRLGYRAAEERVTVRAGEVSVVNFQLTAEAVGLDELLVTVDAMQARRMEVGTSASTIDVTGELGRAVIGSFSELMAGRAAGLDIQTRHGTVGSSSRIQVRGATSLLNVTNPLVIIDGVRVSNETDRGPESIDWIQSGRTVSRLDDLNPADIANIQVMKGPTAVALYGSEAGSGVIIIQTRRGQEGAPQVTLDHEIGAIQDVSEWWTTHGNLTVLLGITDPNDPTAQQWNPIQNPVTGHVWGRHNPMKDPDNSVLQTGLHNNTSLSVSGGSEALNYFISGRYEKTDGVVPNNYLTRVSVRSNVDVRVHENLRIAANLNWLETNVRLPESSRSFRGMSTNAGVGSIITSFGRRPDGSRGDCLATLIRGDPPEVCEFAMGNLLTNFRNLLTVLSRHEVDRFVGSVTATWTPRHWITHRLNVGTDFSKTRDLNMFPLDPARPFGVLSRGFRRDEFYSDERRQVEWAATVSGDLTSDISSATTVGTQYFSWTQNQTSCTGEGGFPSPTATGCGASLIVTALSGAAENRQFGLWGQQRFGFRDYVFGTIGLRRDENSAFGRDEPHIVSPSANVSAILSNMPFWRWETINSFRARVAWGKAASAPRDPFGFMTQARAVRLEEGGTVRQGVSPLRPGNPNLTAERNEELEFGLDGGLWDDRVRFEVSHFRQRVTDAILERFLAPSTGFWNEQFVNIGGLENTGWEFELSAVALRTPTVEWEVDVKHSTQDPIVTDLGGDPPLMLGANRGMFREGYAPGAYYGVVFERAERDAEGRIVPGSVVVRPGDIEGDLSYLGQPNPRNQQSLGSTLTFFGGAVAVSTRFQRVADFQKENSTRLGRDRRGLSEDAALKETLDPVHHAAMNEVQAGRTANGRQYTVEDGDFIKWRELTLRYWVPSHLLNRFFPAASSMILGAGVRNLRVWTNYTGLDPESFVGTGQPTIGNEEFFGMPQPRRWTFRVNVTM